jgi:hypothetical protein
MPKVEREIGESAAPPKPRRMRLPKTSAYPNYNETHEENARCAEVGCIPVCAGERRTDASSPK